MAAKHPNIVVVICHDLGRQLGCYGVDYIRSPRIDAFADNSTRFENSFCAAPQCSPSRAAFWTGRFPHANGVVGLTHAGFANDLNSDERHLAQIIGDAGYETHLFGSQHEARTAERCGHDVIHGGGNCREVASRVAAYLKENGHDGRPKFLEICFQEPHRPFNRGEIGLFSGDEVSSLPYLPDIPSVREDLVDMEASVASADAAFGIILDALQDSEFRENTMIVFTADHGIPFPLAKMTLYDAGIEIPLIISMPDQDRGEVKSEFVSNVDFVPTILELLSMEAPSNLHGVSYAGLINRDTCESRDAIFAEKTYHTYYDPMRCIRTNRFKFIANFEYAPWQETPPDYRNNAKGYVEVQLAVDVPGQSWYHPPFELFDLIKDPYEKRNLAEDENYRETRDDLIRRLYQWMVDTKDPLLNGPVPQGSYTQMMTRISDIVEG